MLNPEKRSIIDVPWRLKGAIGLFLGMVCVEVLALLYFRAFSLPWDICLRLVESTGISSHTASDICGLILTAGIRIMMIIMLIRFVRCQWRGDWKDLGWLTTATRTECLVGLAVSMALGAFAVMVWVLFKFLFQIDLSAAILPSGRVAELYADIGFGLVYLSVACLLAPVVEEVLLRGFLYPPIRNKMSPFLSPRWGATIAILINTLLFVLLHLNWGGFALYGEGLKTAVGGELSGLSVFMPLSIYLVGGFFFAVLYEWRRSLIAPIILHAAGNTGIFLISVIYVYCH